MGWEADYDNRRQKLSRPTSSRYDHMHRNPGAILLHNTCFQNHVLGGGAKLEIVDALTQPGARKDGVLQQLDLKTKPPDCLQACN